MIGTAPSIEWLRAIRDSAACCSFVYVSHRLLLCRGVARASEEGGGGRTEGSICELYEAIDKRAFSDFALFAAFYFLSPPPAHNGRRRSAALFSSSVTSVAAAYTSVDRRPAKRSSTVIAIHIERNNGLSVPAKGLAHDHFLVPERLRPGRQVALWDGWYGGWNDSCRRRDPVDAIGT